MIDLWGFLKVLWAEKLVWLSVFVVVLAAGGVAGGYAGTRPPVYEVTQTIMLGIPPANSTADAIQQLDALNETTSVVFSRAALRPPVTDAVLESHPEIKSLAELQGQVVATAIGDTLEFQSKVEDPAAGAKLISDLTRSFSEQLPTLTKANPPALRYTATLWSDPTVIPITSGGRMFSLVSAAALAALIATVAAAVRSSLRRR